MRSICISIVATLALAGTSFADTITVCLSGCDYSDITSALEHASNGDVIEITPDDPMGYMPFTIDNHLTITINGNGATIQGKEGMDMGGVFVEGGVTVTINDLRIAGNAAESGGGIFVEGGATVTLSNCTITDNSAGEGGGMFVEGGATVTLNNCTISGNTAGSSGGGIYCGGSSPTIRDCHITDNRVTDEFAFAGGGISAIGSSNPHLIGGTVSGNTNFLGFPANLWGGVTQSLRGEQSELGTIILEDSTVCGTGEYNITGVLIEHRGENHISDCVDEGDLNGDGAIDSTDLDAMHAAVGICTSDVNHDGDTNVLDLLGVIDEWGGVCP